MFVFLLTFVLSSYSFHHHTVDKVKISSRVKLLTASPEVIIEKDEVSVGTRLCTIIESEVGMTHAA